MYFSVQTGGFYDPDMHGPFEPGNPACGIPSDAVEISREQWAELLAGNAAGQIITVKKGLPVLADPPPPTSDELMDQERRWRDGRLTQTDSVVTRHRDEQEDGAATTLTADQYSQLQAYRRALRAWPESGEFPLSQHRPPAPEWLSGLLA
ncbi:tail fiber assembly protein [Pseudomonas sp. MSSRFD41]|uniref:tail fiber assembly protein n=1 Tax=Pseudomonas sp. MSSRFD41 TaxID=1310370 RepID=UPI001639AD0F|nr:tail fiber assembly protein [Pseudomonas sp. MSSRFD41]MBC2657744.1 tail fiber assembly protein [Pseudomonas sp. MSSRFD41]